MNEPEEPTPGVHCPTCSSERVLWRVKRTPSAFSRASQATLVWTCKDCGAGWEEPVRGGYQGENGHGSQGGTPALSA
jgi:DNA-directed RNA polymerase subunit M/transcription elongation factor TFIIS